MNTIPLILKQNHLLDNYKKTKKTLKNVKKQLCVQMYFIRLLAFNAEFMLTYNKAIHLVLDFRFKMVMGRP